MPLYIQHRINKISELANVETQNGVEIDLRSNVNVKSSLHLSHDAWTLGDSFSDWADAFKARKISGPIILNTKEDGLESAAEDILKQRGISNYFFLDTALPTLVKHAVIQNNNKFALRISAYEPAVMATTFKNKIEWLWIDCFNGIPLNADEFAPLKSDFKICLVSPELHGQPTDTISKFQNLYLLADAICTKVPNLWKQKFS